MRDTPYEPIYNRDWISAFLKWSRLTPIGAGLVLATLNLLINGLFAQRSGTWLDSPAGMGLLSDYQVLVFAFLFQPTVIASFCWFPQGMQHLYEGIAREDVFESAQVVKRSYEHLRKRFQVPLLVPIAAAWASFACFAEYYIFFRPLTSSWLQIHPEFFWFRLPLEFIFNFMLAMGFYDTLMLLMEIRKLFRENPVRVQPLHPDRAGGLGAVGRFTSNIGYAVGAIGLFLTVVLFQRPPGTALLYNIMLGLMFAVYFSMAPISFYFPLWSAHDAMLSVRDTFLRNISSEFDAVHTRLQSMRSKDAEKNEPLLKRLRQLAEERELIERYPVWPFDASSLRKFFGLALSPLVPILTSIFVDLLANWLP